MNLREKLDEVKQMAPGWEHYRAMCDVFPALLEVVERQHRALELIALAGDETCKRLPGECRAECFETLSEVRAALSLMDKEVK